MAVGAKVVLSELGTGRRALIEDPKVIEIVGISGGGCLPAQVHIEHGVSSGRRGGGLLVASHSCLLLMQIVIIVIEGFPCRGYSGGCHSGGGRGGG